jgi:phosphate transport system permease protein
MNRQRRSLEKWAETIVRWGSWLAVVIPLAILALLVGDVIVRGAGRLSWEFLSSFPSRHPAEAGILPAIVGSLAVVGLTAAIAVPVGIAAAVYLEEYAEGGKVAELIEVNIANLAGVPSVIYGLLGLEIFVRLAAMGQSVLAGACTLALLVLPIVIMSAREAIRTVPDELREASLGLGATRWQTIRGVVLPMALPGMLTGAILAISRAIGETAPLLVVGALTYVTFLPQGVDSPFTVLPIQIFNWTSRPQEGFVVAAAAGIIVLLSIMLLLNAIAIYWRDRFERER